MTGKIKSPKIYDPYLGEMYGNILDKYDNPAYNLRLYLKPEAVGGVSTASATGSSATATQGATTTPADSTAGARSDTPSAPATTTVPDKKIVVVAQTGVTGNQIDNLEIDGVPDQNGTLNLSFTVIQPGAANLLDQIQYGRKYIGVPEDQLNAGDFTMYLDVNFVGYTIDTVDDIGQPDDNEAGGNPAQIVDTITYKIIVRKIGVKVDNTGSQYNFECSVEQSIGRADEIYRLSKSITIRGNSITTFFRDLEIKYNDSIKIQSTEYTPDQVRFDVSALLGRITAPGEQGTTTTGGVRERLYIKNEVIPTQATDQRVETTTAPSYENTAGVTAPDLRNSSDGVSVTGSSDRVIDGVDLTLQAGDSIEKITATILSMNEEFQQLATRRRNLNDPGDREVDNERSFIAWFDIHCQVENLGWDKKRGRYTRKYTYTPYLTKDIRSDILLTTTELDYLKEKGQAFGAERPITAIATKRLQDLYNAGALHKSYFYIFTGLNDQIINLDIAIDNAITILVPPKGGMSGDSSVTLLPALSNSAPIDSDLTLDTVQARARDAQNRESLLGIFNKIRGIGGDLSDTISGIAQTLERSPSEIAGIINDATGGSARRFAESLTSADTERLVQRLGVSDGADAPDTPTTNTEISVTTTGTYSPEVSGFLYAEDIIQPGSFTTEEIEAAGLNVLDSSIPTDVGHATPQTRSVPSPLSGMTSTGPSSVLMGYVYRSRAGDPGDQFLLNVDLTIRGDPYWLTNLAPGKFEYGKTTPDQVVAPAETDYYFLLTIGTPTRYDFDIRDEDNNTGYWSDGRTSGVFSGLFYPRAWKNRFSNGIFTTEIKAVKEIAVPLQWIRRVPPGVTPPAWDQYFSREEYEDVTNQAINSRRTAATAGAGSNDPRSPPIAPEDLPALQIGGEKNNQAKAAAEQFLGRPIDPAEWNLLIRATAGESGGGTSEDAAIAGVILNRARTNYGGNGTGIREQLYARGQFEAITGRGGANRGFTNPTEQQIGRITNNILNGIGSASTSWDSFTSKYPDAYRDKTPSEASAYIAQRRAVPGAREVGGTIFYDSTQLRRGR